jgi:acetylornithine deacetylase/succinyl-diaminopimelate desuccinylase-like protein
VAKHAPRGVKFTVRRLAGKAKPYLVPADHPGNRAVHEVLSEIYGTEPFYTRTGGTIPVCELFLTNLNAYTVSFAFGLNDENVHAPDEFFRLSSWERGQTAYCKLLERLGR